MSSIGDMLRCAAEHADSAERYGENKMYARSELHSASLFLDRAALKLHDEQRKYGRLVEEAARLP